MRRENRKDNVEGGLNLKNILYVSGSILAIAIIGFVATVLIYGNSDDGTKIGMINTSIVDNYSVNFEENTEEASSQLGRTINEISNEEVEYNSISEESNNIISNTVTTNNSSNTTKYAVNTSEAEKNIKTKNDTSNKKNQEKISEPETKKEEKVEDPKFKNPVDGEIIKEYAKDKLVYSNTLGEWVTHSGIDIKADKTTVVKASAEGTVKSIKNDPRYGLTVVIEHVNGFSSIYANLLTAEFVVEGEKVKQGQTIGTVGNTATFEISDESHLHFEIKKDSENLDPELYIKK